MSTNSKLSFVERVMALLTGGDQGKVERFYKNARKLAAKPLGYVDV